MMHMAVWSSQVPRRVIPVALQADDDQRIISISPYSLDVFCCGAVGTAKLGHNTLGHDSRVRHPAPSPRRGEGGDGGASADGRRPDASPSLWPSHVSGGG
jgi:hypothetical protein